MATFVEFSRQQKAAFDEFVDKFSSSQAPYLATRPAVENLLYGLTKVRTAEEAQALGISLRQQFSDVFPAVDSRILQDVRAPDLTRAPATAANPEYLPVPTTPMASLLPPPPLPPPTSLLDMSENAAYSGFSDADVAAAQDAILATLTQEVANLDDATLAP